MLNTIVEKRHDRVEIIIGERFGYSGTIVHKDPLTGTSISHCCGNSVSSPNYRQHVLIATYPLFLWEVFVSEPEIVDRVKNGQFKHEWADRLFKETITVLASTDQLPGALLHTVNMVYDKGIKDGKRQKLEEIHAVFDLTNIM